MHPLEHRHTLGEVQHWFRENAIDYVRSYPTALLGQEPLEGDELFIPAEDDWGFESVSPRSAGPRPSGAKAASSWRSAKRNPAPRPPLPARSTAGGGRAGAGVRGGQCRWRACRVAGGRRWRGPPLPAARAS